MNKNSTHRVKEVDDVWLVELVAVNDVVLVRFLDVRGRWGSIFVAINGSLLVVNLLRVDPTMGLILDAIRGGPRVVITGDPSGTAGGIFVAIWG
jgi:hypothetical protein